MDKVIDRIFEMQKVFPLIKADESTHTVYGLVTASTPDKEGEICNYKAAKKAYQAWSGEAENATSKSGQDVSLGNVRVQHTDQVGGKVTKLEFDDEKEEIYVASTPIDDTMWDAIAGGYYTGYSQGGDYSFRICQECGDTVPKSKGNYCGSCKKVVPIEYGPVIAEVSYVDNPCHGSAHFDLVKADGTHRMVKFRKQRSTNMEQEEQESPELSKATLGVIGDIVKSAVTAALAKEAKTKRVAGEDLGSDCFAYVGDKDDTSTWKLPIKFSTDAKTKSHVRNALARFEQTKGIPEGEKAKVKSKIEAAAKKHGIEVSDEAKKSANFKGLVKNFIEQAVGERLPDNLRKDMYTVARFAGLINEVAYVLWSTQYEAEIEQDNSELPGELQEDLENLVETFLSMAQEESNELTAATAERIGKVMKGVTATGLDKAYNKAAGIINKMKKAVSDHHEATTAANDTHAEKMKGHCEDLKDAMTGKAEKSTTAITLTKTAYSADEVKELLAKAIPKSGAKENESDACIDDQEEGDVEEIDPSEEATENIAQKSYNPAQVERMINKAVNAAVQGVVKQLSKKDDEEDDEEEKPVKKAKKPADDEEDDEEPAKAKKSAAAGIGDRTQTRTGPVIKTVPVTKETDGLPSMTKSATEEPEVDQKTVAKAIQNGDIGAQLRLMKSAKPHNAVPSTLVGAVGAIGKRRA